MKFSTRSRYALRLMAELARCAPGKPLSLKEISERQQLSLKYLEQIVTPLARAGLVKSERGSQGGYHLVKAPSEYTAGEILRAIEGSVAPIPCLESEVNVCPLCDQCFTLPFWTGLDEVINRYMDSVTLADLSGGLSDGQAPAAGCVPKK
ncbi:MAG: Rrf2 family transcriptional regulator [Candidatus Faecalibacterium intestinavium]|uniref:Rrf2 family transcriptional regulator n=1 Tax=Candidatus Faecalibacterium intestinavium TaxID=2838580 RepID=A0A9E2KK24_9FIRM|nr:Rrf2 family transcriptional regulator [Candidatus Faecalibacterium intestinavium]